jgi:hypothetical protein
MLAVADVYKRKTPKKIARALEMNRSRRDIFSHICQIPGWGKWVFPLYLGIRPPSLSPPTNVNPFFVFGDWSGTVGWIRGLLPYLKSDRSFVALEDPLLSDPTGVSSGRTNDMSFAAYCLYLAKCIRSIQSNGPYYLLGYSVGGLVAYEVSRHLINIQNREETSTLKNESIEKVIGSLILIDPQPVWDLFHSSSAKWFITAFFLCDSKMTSFCRLKMRKAQEKEAAKRRNQVVCPKEGEKPKGRDHSHGKIFKKQSEKIDSLWNFCVITLLHSQIPLDHLNRVSHTLSGNTNEGGENFRSQLKKTPRTLRLDFTLRCLSTILTSSPSPSASLPTLSPLSISSPSSELPIEVEMGRLKSMFFLETEFTEHEISSHIPLPLPFLSPAKSHSCSASILLISPYTSSSSTSSSSSCSCTSSLPVMNLIEYWNPLLHQVKPLFVPLSSNGYQASYHLPFQGKIRSPAAMLHVYCIHDDQFCLSIAKKINKI